MLDLRPLVLRLGDRFGFINNLADKIPQDSAQVTILKSDDLKLAQDVTHWLEQVANFVWILALACWVGAIWLARGRRRQEVRSLGIGLVVVGVLVLLSRWLAGNYFVDNLVQSDTVRPAASDAWNIITDSLAAAGWVALSVGILIAVGAWLVGPGERATAARASLAPLLRRTGRRVGRLRARDGAAHLDPADPGLPHDRDPRRARSDRVRGAPAPGRCARAGRAREPDAAEPRPAARRRRVEAPARSASGAAVAAAPVQHDLVRPHAVVEPLRRLLERLLEAGVEERLDLAAVVADEVVVVLAAQV